MLNRISALIQYFSKNGLFRKTVSLVLFFLIQKSVYAANFKITGIKGEPLQNVRYRLSELYQDKPLTTVPRKELQAQIEKALHPYGFFRPKISFAVSSEGTPFRIQITPGPQLHIATMTIQVTGEGADNAEIRQALRDLPLKAGQPLNNPIYEEAKENIQTAAEHQGYLHGIFEKAEVLIDLNRYRADITLIYNTGPQFYFRQLKFDPTHISKELLYRYVPFEMGQPYSTDKVLALESNLSASGYFKSVIVKPEMNSRRLVPVNVHLEAVNRINYTLGIGYGTDTGPRGRVGLHVVPVNSAGHKFNAIAQGSLQENALLAQYIIPGRDPLHDKYSVSASFSNLDYSSGYANSALLSLAHQHLKTNHQRVISLNALHERFNYTNTPKTEKTLLYPKATLTWRKVTDQLFSPSGYNITLNGLAASKLLLSEINLAQASIDVKAALTVKPIRTRFFVHGIQGFTAVNDIENLPLSLALLLGGAENLKAYSYNSVGPGKILSFIGGEIQKETFEKWYLVGFLDAGDVYNPGIKDFKYDAGIALMWVSPVGPIKVGVAQAINRDFQRIDGRNPKLVINMGPDL